MRLFIAEKPSLGRAIAESLGKGVAKDGCIECSGGQDIVTWCFGHILEQCYPGIRGKQVEIINTLLADVKTMEIEVNKDLPVCPDWCKVMRLRKGKYGNFLACTGHSLPITKM